MRDLVWVGAALLLGFVWFVAAAWSIRAFGPGVGGMLAFLAPLAPLAAVVLVAFVAHARRRKRLRDQEFRE